jgi:hypothetical protein
VLTAHTDKPPAYIALARFEKPEEIWSDEYWRKWHASLSENALPLQRRPQDHIEVGVGQSVTVRIPLALEIRFIVSVLSQFTTYRVVLGKGKCPLFVHQNHLA